MTEPARQHSRSVVFFLKKWSPNMGITWCERAPRIAESRQRCSNAPNFYRIHRFLPWEIHTIFNTRFSTEKATSRGINLKYLQCRTDLLKEWRHLTNVDTNIYTTCSSEMAIWVTWHSTCSFSTVKPVWKDHACCQDKNGHSIYTGDLSWKTHCT